MVAGVTRPRRAKSSPRKAPNCTHNMCRKFRSFPDEHHTVVVLAESMTCRHTSSTDQRDFGSCCSTSDTSLLRSRSNQKGHRRAKTICDIYTIILYYKEEQSGAFTTWHCARELQPYIRIALIQSSFYSLEGGGAACWFRGAAFFGGTDQSFTTSISTSTPRPVGPGGGLAVPPLKSNGVTKSAKQDMVSQNRTSSKENVWPTHSRHRNTATHRYRNRDEYLLMRVQDGSELLLLPRALASILCRQKFESPTSDSTGMDYLLQEWIMCCTQHAATHRLGL